jgi:septal ring factor EnvC (AmiA/AmiB activator)
VFLLTNHCDIQTIIKKLNSISDEIKVEVNEMSAEETKKNDKIKEVEKSLKQLQENKSINKQQENIKKWFELDKLTNSLKNKADEINTTNITCQINCSLKSDLLLLLYLITPLFQH